MCYGNWKPPTEAPQEYQKVTVAFQWNECEYQLAAGTYHDGEFYQDSGDMERRIDGVEWWTPHFPVPPLANTYSYPWIQE